MRRTDKDYEIESLTKGLQVLEALEGIGFEPVSYDILIERTGLSRDFILRALRTMKLCGFAVKEGRRWTVGKRFIRLAQKLGEN